MFDWDAVIIGGGPAGLTAGLYLARANRRVILLEKEVLGGYPKNVEWIENYPGFSDGVSGAQLVSAMADQATKYGLKTEVANVTGIELFSSCRWVGCADGRGYTTAVVIVAAGARLRKLGVPGEEALRGKGVFDCALCDGGQYAGQSVTVCGGGDAALTEALYMAKIASTVILIHRRDQLRATGVLQERASREPKIEFILDSTIDAIHGTDKVESVRVRNSRTGETTDMRTDGVLVHVGLDPNTEFLSGSVPLDAEGQVLVNGRMETEVPHVLAAGDIRSGSPRQIATAVGDGAVAAITAQHLLDQIV